MFVWNSAENSMFGYVIMAFSPNSRQFRLTNKAQGMLPIHQSFTTKQTGIRHEQVQKIIKESVHISEYCKFTESTSDFRKWFCNFAETTPDFRSSHQRSSISRPAHRNHPRRVSKPSTQIWIRSLVVQRIGTDELDR